MEFGIVIPLYNKERYISNTLRSVLAQRFTDFCVVIVDDGSTDNSVQVARSFTDKRIHLFSQTNQGVSAARNHGIAEARKLGAKYICLLDGDDVWKDCHLELMHHLITKYPSCKVFATSYEMKEEGKEPVRPKLAGSLKEGYEGVLTNYYELAGKSSDVLFQIGVLAISVSVIDKTGGFMVGLPSGEDRYFMARMALFSPIAFSNKVTLTYLTGTVGREHRPIAAIRKVNKHFDSLLKEGRGKPGIRLFVSAWHKQQMVTGLLSRQYGYAFCQFWRAAVIYPWQPKLFTSFFMTMISMITGVNLTTLNKWLKRLRP